MPTTVKKVALWRGEVDNKPGALAAILRPLAAAGANLKVTMAYRHPGNEKAAVEVYPIAGKRMMTAARNAGLLPSDIPTLFVEGDDKAGLGAATFEAIAEKGINVAFVVTEVAGRKYTSILGFESDADAKAATPILKKAGTRPKK